MQSVEFFYIFEKKKKKEQNVCVGRKDAPTISKLKNGTSKEKEVSSCSIPAKLKMLHMKVYYGLGYSAMEVGFSSFLPSPFF